MRYRRIRYNSAGLVFILENCFLLLSGCGWECSETDCTAGTASRVLVKTGPRTGPSTGRATRDTTDHK